MHLSFQLNDAGRFFCPRWSIFYVVTMSTPRPSNVRKDVRGDKPAFCTFFAYIHYWLLWRRDRSNDVIFIYGAGGDTVTLLSADGQTMPRRLKLFRIDLPRCAGRAANWHALPNDASFSMTLPAVSMARPSPLLARQPPPDGHGILAIIISVRAYVNISADDYRRLLSSQRRLLLPIRCAAIRCWPLDKIYYYAEAEIISGACARQRCVRRLRRWRH